MARTKRRAGVAIAVAVALIGALLPVALAAGPAGASQPNDINTIAGGGNTYADGDVPTATNVSPWAVATDAAGDVFMSDNTPSLDSVFEIPATTKTQYGIAMTAGLIYRVAGGGGFGYGGDGGRATSARFDYPDAIASDAAGDLFIADVYNERIREVAATTGTQYGISMTAGDIYTVAGGAGWGSAGDGGAATAAQLELTSAPGFGIEHAGVAVDGAGNIYIADGYNNEIRMVAAVSATHFGQAMTAGDIYTIAGSTTFGYVANGGSVQNARFESPNAIGVDAAGNVYVLDNLNDNVGNFGTVVIKLAAVSGTEHGLTVTANHAYTIAGNGQLSFAGCPGDIATTAHFNAPDGIAATPAGDVFLADTYDQAVCELPAVSRTHYGVTMTAGHVYAVAGDGTGGFTGDDGPALQAEVAQPTAVALDSGGDLFIADNGNGRLREVNTGATAGVPISGTVTTTSNNQTVPVADALIQACSTTNNNCTATGLTTDDNGKYTLDVPGPDTYVVTAFPQPSGGVDLGVGTTDPSDVGPNGATGLDITLPVITPFPDSVSVNGQKGVVPVLKWSSDATITATGCPNGLAMGTYTGTDEFTDQVTTVNAALTESPPGSGNYEGTIPALYPIHGDVTSSVSFDCSPDTALAPASGPAAGGTTVRVNGSRFTGATAVNFGPNPAPSFTVVSDSEIDAIAPAGTGTVDVTVVTPGGSTAASGIDEYTYLSVDHVAPASGDKAGGTTVTITGVGLDHATALYFGADAVTDWTIDSATQITATTPAVDGPGPVDITIQAVDGSVSDATPTDVFTYTGAGAMTRARPVHRQPLVVAPTRRPTSSARLDGRAGLAPLLTPLTGPAKFLVDQADFLTNMIKKMKDKCSKEKFPQALLDAFLAQLGDAGKELAQKLADSGPVALPIPFLVAAGLLFLPGELAGGITAGGILTAIAVGTAVINLLKALPELNKDLGALADCAKKSLPKLPKISPNCKTKNCIDIPIPVIGGKLRIDPSGTVVDTNGNPIENATVTLLRSDTAIGPFTAPPNGSAVMDPSVNPETSDATGEFHWEVYAGYYQVQANAPNCHAPGNAAEPTVSTPTLPVPPPQVGLVLTMECTNQAPPPTPTVSALDIDTGTTGGGTAVQITGTGFAADAIVSFGGTAATGTTVLSPTTIDAVAPAGTGTVDVTVRTAGGPSPQTAADQFTYVAPPADTAAPIVTLSFPPPASGYFASASVQGQVIADDSTTGDSTITQFSCPGATVTNFLALSKTASATVTVSGEGVHTITCTATDSSGNTGAQPFFDNSGTVKIDTQVPAAKVTAPGGNTSGSAVSVKWSGADNLSGVAHFDVQVRTAAWNAGFGAWRSFKSATKATAGTYSAPAGTSVCVRVRATDKAGNTSAYSSERCTSVPLTASAFHLSSGWAKASSRAYYGGFAFSTTSKGRSATRTGIKARRLSLVATECSSCGVVQVRWNNKVIATVNLAHATTLNNQVIALRPFTSVQSGTLSIIVTSANGKRVLLEGLAVGAF